MWEEWSQSQIITVMQIKTTMRSHFSPLKLAIHFLNDKANEHRETLNASSAAAGVNWRANWSSE